MLKLLKKRLEEESPLNSNLIYRLLTASKAFA